MGLFFRTCPLEVLEIEPHSDSSVAGVLEKCLREFVNIGLYQREGGGERECAHKDRESTNKIEMVSFEDNAKEREKRDRDNEQIGVHTREGKKEPQRWSRHK